jgi:hypothetical protein
LCFLYGLAHWLDWHPVLVTLPSGLPVDPTAVLGVVGTVLAFALFVCTAMIYACLKFLAEWHSPLTVVNYILLGSASGFTLAAGIRCVHAAPELVGFLAGWAAIITVLGLISRAASLFRNARLKPKSSLRTAIGVKHPRIVQKGPGLHGRQLQHARVLSRTHRWRAVRGEVGLSDRCFSSCRCYCLGFGLRGSVDAAESSPSQSSIPACWLSAGSFLPKPIIRRIYIINRLPE